MTATVDHHMHLGYGDFRKENRSDQYKGTDLDKAYNNLLMYADAGITRLRDGSDKMMCAFRLRGEAASLGIELESAGRAIVKQGRYGIHLGYPVATLADIDREMDFLYEQGVDWFKVTQSGLVDMTGAPQDETPSFSAREMARIVETARGCNTPVMVHVNFEEPIRLAVEAGVDTIEHGYFMTEELLLAMKQRGIAWCPTLAPFANALTYGRAIRGWDWDVIQTVVARHKAMVQKAAELGVRLLAGSDAGSSIVPHGRGTADEHTLLRELIGDSFE